MSFLPLAHSLLRFLLRQIFVCVETDKLLDGKEVELGRKAADELDWLWSRIKTGQCAMSELEETELFERIKQNA